MEKTYIMIKPGFLKYEDEIKKRIEKIGGKILKRKQFRMTRKLAEEHYSNLNFLKEKFIEGEAQSVFDSIIDYMISGEVVGMIVEGENIISEVRRILGPTKDASKGTIRGDFSTGTTQNVLHASDGPNTANDEIERFFGKCANNLTL